MRARPSRLLAAILVAAAAGVLLGCASSPRDNRAAGHRAVSRNTAPLPGKPGCFWVTDFNNSWTALNDGELIVYDPLFGPYLMKLFEPVPNLKYRHQLGFEASPPDRHRICSSSMDYLLVRHFRSGRVPIVAVRKLTRAQERQLLLQNHIKLPDPLATEDRGTTR